VLGTGNVTSAEATEGRYTGNHSGSACDDAICTSSDRGATDSGTAHNRAARVRRRGAQPEHECGIRVGMETV
jgi:hypothetical protein